MIDTDTHSNQCDVGVLTVVSTEVEALFSIFEITDKNKVFVNSPFDYWMKEYLQTRTGRPLKIVFSFILGEQGNIESAVATVNFLRDWHPRLLAMVGITAGIEGKCSIGDVIIPTKIHDRHLKAFIDGTFRFRGKTYNVSDAIMTQLKTRPLRADNILQHLPDNREAEFDILKQSAKDVGLRDKDLSLYPKLLDGSVVSDDVLVRDAKYFQGVLTDVDERCRGAEMESAGFVRACQAERPDFPWIIFRGVSDFGDNRKSDKFQFHAARNACAVLKEFIKHSVDTSRLPNNPRAVAAERALITGLDLLSVIYRAFEDKRWEEVCRIGRVLSRPLLLAGRLRNRIQVGQLVEKAAAYIGQDDTRAAALIDDIGWTHVLMKDNDEARRSIRDGLRIATHTSNEYLLAKGYRHLASIERQERNADGAAENLGQAGQHASIIGDHKLKLEMEASLESSLGKLLIERGGVEDGLEQLRKAQSKFNDIGDVERSAKLFVSIGQAEQQLGRPAAALKAFEDGRAAARKIGRYFELKECTLAELALKGNGRPDLDDPIFAELYDYARDAGAWDEVKRLDDLKQRESSL